eukprot:560760-Hanusia_phi.AAC.1
MIKVGPAAPECSATSASLGGSPGPGVPPGGGACRPGPISSDDHWHGHLLSPTHRRSRVALPPGPDSGASARTLTEVTVR